MLGPCPPGGGCTYNLDARTSRTQRRSNTPLARAALAGARRTCERGRASINQRSAYAERIWHLCQHTITKGRRREGLKLSAVQPTPHAWAPPAGQVAPWSVERVWVPLYNLVASSRCLIPNISCAHVLHRIEGGRRRGNGILVGLLLDLIRARRRVAALAAAATAATAAAAAS